ncbi:ImmA/IrrE family metallo-endopeptidase [Natranaerobius thermophilus]|uniref:IrrE N-terminal-like domain-containing protein n=1 Tax=Natranaerobius thermophilus (strain ATCC BAA-1301 / DSM 18059 / JW/NM-WN-LF) TaxID=457570 RepID=B2A1C9_NATTJ|nr:ImmA/IrrE family metallo-endopeptidase [Natranaerobius thermophilus]ACB86067.1 protein of unknown function DUF955 [Natranaerobius thermophilus JW/NM-WN-LF]
MDKSRRLEIEKLVDNVRNESNVTDYGFENIFDALEKLGVKVIRYPIGKYALLGFSLVKDTDKIIFTNSSSILSREIFTAAHELGHQKLHLSEHGITMIKDNDLEERYESETEANYFAACLLMPDDKVNKFMKLVLNDKPPHLWTGWDIARIQTTFNVSYDMVLYRLKFLGILNESLLNKLYSEKAEKTATRLLTAISGNSDLCKAAEKIKIPDEFLEWVITNYHNKLISEESARKALSYVKVNLDDLVFVDEQEQLQEKEKEELDDLIGRME